MPTRKHKQRRILKTKKRGGFKSDEEIIDELKHKYVKKIINEIRLRYNKHLMFDFIDRNQYMPQTIIPSMFRKDPIENKKKITFEDLKNKIKNNCSLKTNNMNASEEWINEFYGQIATVYINSKNVRKFLNNKEMTIIREEYLNLIKNHVLRTIVVEPENYQNHNNIEMFDYDDDVLDISINVKKRIGKRIFHITFSDRLL